MDNQGAYILSARPDNDTRCAGIPPMFKASFPGVLLRHFDYTHGAYDPRISITYEGLETELLHYGLVTPDMLAAPPKRKAFARHGVDDADCWWTERLARRRVRATLHGLPGWLPALGPFAADRFPWFESSVARRSYCQQEIEKDAEALMGVIPALTRGAAKTLEKHGFRWHEGVDEELVGLAERYADDLAERIRSAPLVSTAQPTLRVVADNTRPISNP